LNQDSPITIDDLEDYATKNADFGFEMRVYSALTKRRRPERDGNLKESLPRWGLPQPTI
jgi:hypothetical protein